MGDPRRQRKKYEGPAHPWRIDTLSEELKILGEFGLRNKRELWKATSTLRKYRAIARKLFAMSGEKREKLEKALIEKLVKLGVLQPQSTIDDILGLTVRDFLKRRLQTILYDLGYAKTIYHARQLIAHGHVFVGYKKVRSPSYHVKRGEEGKIKVKIPIEVNTGK